MPIADRIDWFGEREGAEREGADCRQNESANESIDCSATRGARTRGSRSFLDTRCDGIPRACSV